MKRALDIVLSFLVLVALSPLLLLIALAVVIDSGLPVFYRQERVGREFGRFFIWKFRSMRASGAGPRITVAGDARVTRVGRFLRATKLDELPQFWNVLRGDMSLVGPRPEVEEYVKLFEEQFRRILVVRPGITDLASITFRNEEAVLAASADPQGCYRREILPAKLALAEEYVAKRTLAMDLRILAQTAGAILR